MGKVRTMLDSTYNQCYSPTIPMSGKRIENHHLYIDLLVATYKRTYELERLLKSLSLQTYSYFRIIIADQNTEGFLASVLAQFPHLSITVVAVEQSGVSQARNALLSAAQSDIIAFPDDDCWYAPDTLKNVVTFFSKNQQVGACMAVWGDSEKTTRFIGKMGSPLTYIECFRRGETYVQFFRREIVTAVGNFDPRLGPGTGLPYGGGEDTDYLLRALAFTPIIRVREIHVFHPEVSPNAPEIEKKVQRYAAGRIALLKKHRLPLWFFIANIIYPFVQTVTQTLKGNHAKRRYFFCMFKARISALFLPPCS